MFRYLISAIEQALWSLLNLGVNLLLIRLVAPAQYGTFAFWVNCAFVLTSFQNALTVCHLQVLAPGDPLSEPRLSVERLMHGVTALFLIAVAGGAWVGVAVLKHEGSVLASPATILFLPAFALQQYIRALAFTRGRPMTAAIQTGMVAVVAVTLLGAAYACKVLAADTILLSLGAAYGLVGAVGGGLAVRGQIEGVSFRALGGFRHYLAQSGWVFLGVSSTELLTRFYAFAVTGWYGPAALASLSATQQLLRPIPLLAASWGMVARTDLAQRRDAGDWKGIARIVALATVGGIVLAALWTLMIFTGWGLITRELFGGKYAADGWMVLLWGAASMIGFGQIVVGAGLQALRAFKPLALANTAASLIAAAAILAIMRQFGPGGAIAGTAIGQLLEFFAMAAILGLLLYAQTKAKRSGGSQS